MSRSNPYQPSYNAGEISEYLEARTDFRKYQNAVKKAQNVIPLLEGGLMRRAGTRYIADGKSDSAKQRLKRFQFSTEQAYVLEFGNTSIRFFRNQGQISAADITASIENGSFTDAIQVAFSHVWQVDDTPSDNAFVDETTDANDAGTGDWALFPATEANGDYAAFGYTTTFGQIKFNYASGTAGVGGVVTWEYWNGSAWTALSSVSDETSSFTTAAADDLNVSFLIPSDWAALVINSSASLFWVRARITTVYSTNPVMDQGFIKPAWIERSGAGSTSTRSAGGRLDLTSSGSTAAHAEQRVINSLAINHVLKFQVLGSPGDTVKLRIGIGSQSTNIVNDFEAQVGWHVYEFTATAANFFIGFLHSTGKTIEVDVVSLMDDIPLDLGSPYATADLFQIMGPQTADVLYLFHGSYATHKLERRGHARWALVEVAWQDGPWLDTNITATTLTPSATTGLGIDVTASAVAGINGGQGFISTDVGRLIRIDNPSSGIDWGWAIITSITSTTVVKVDIKRAFLDTTADANWKLGSWSSTTGYPSTGSIYEERLFAANNTDFPEAVWASGTGDYENHSPDSPDSSDVWGGTVEDDDAFLRTVPGEDVESVLWLSPGDDTLAIGTFGGQWKPVSNGAVLTPTDAVIRKQTSTKSARVLPVRVDHVVLFVQRALLKVYEFAFSFENDGFRSNNMTRLARHVTRGGIVEIDFQSEPNDLLWTVRSDGIMPTMTYRREEDIVGWARQILGGSFGTGGAVVESVTVIPGTNGAGQVQDSTGRDEVWVSIKRTIDGTTVRYVEMFERDWEEGDDQEDAYYSDSIITYDSTATNTITGLGHLEGETVKVWADGAIHPDRTVVSGSITLDDTYSVVQVGLGYFHEIETLKFEGGVQAGTAVGKIKQIFAVTFVLLNSHTLTWGADANNLNTVDFREVADPMDAGVPFFTGEHFEEFDDDWENDVRMTIKSDDPCPFTLLAHAPEIDTKELK